MSDSVLRLNIDDIDQDLGDFVTFEGKPFTGIVYENHPVTGQLVNETEYRDGRIWGFSREWFSTNQLSLEQYVDQRGNIDGHSKEWFFNGQLKSDALYDHGVLVWKKEWNEQGELLRERDARGKLIKQITTDPEAVVLVNEKDEIIGKSTRQEAAQQGAWIRQVFVLLVNTQGNILLGKQKDEVLNDKDRWTSAIFGSISGDDEPGDTAVHLIEERLGLDIGPKELHYITKIIAFSESKGKRWGGPSTLYEFKGEIDPSVVSAEDLAWFSQAELDAALRGGRPLMHNGELVVFSEAFRPIFQFYKEFYAK